MKSRIKRGVLAAVAFIASTGFAGASLAQSCTAYPNSLTNGTTADASQVMGNFSCAALTGNGIFTGNVGIGTTSPASNLTVINSAGSGYGGPTSGTWAARIVNGNDTSGQDGLSVQNAWLSSGSTVFEVAAGWNGSAIGYYPMFTIDGIGDIIWKNYAQTTLAYFNSTTGDVGIGTASPSAPLEIYNNSYGLEVANSGGYSTQLNYNQLYSTGGSLYLNYSTTNNTIINSNGGQVAIGTPTPSSGYALTVSGSALASGGAWVNSDGRLKDHVATVTNGLALVERLRPVRYDWLPTEKRTVGKDLKLATDRHQIGFIAQEVEKVVPEAITAPTPGHADAYSMNEAALIPVLTAALKEQQAEIEELKAEVEKLKPKS